jgi:hypothetical protein
MILLLLLWIRIIKYLDHIQKKDGQKDKQDFMEMGKLLYLNLILKSNKFKNLKL